MARRNTSHRSKPKPARPQRKKLKPKTKNQEEYIRSIAESDVTFCTGPAGSGKTAVAAIKLTLENMQSSGVISKYDKFIGEKIAYVLSGGDTDITKEVIEENILKLEKDAIYNLMKENLTIERLEHILETGKYLRN